jgi:DNA-binding GntR family transcriptional regulator
MASQPTDLAVLQRSSLATALERELEHLIIAGELLPGERLNELRLAARFGTSRGPLREATRSLVAKGFLQVVRNRGVYVRELSTKEVSEIYAVRGALFAAAGRLAAKNMNSRILGKLKLQLRKMQEATDAQEVDTYYPLNLEFHTMIVETSRNATLQLEYHRCVKTMHLFRWKSLVQGGGLSVSNQEHQEIVMALQSGDADRAFLAHWHHVESARQRVVSALDGCSVRHQIIPDEASDALGGGLLSGTVDQVSG